MSSDAIHGRREAEVGEGHDAVQVDDACAHDDEGLERLR